MFLMSKNSVFGRNHMFTRPFAELNDYSRKDTTAQTRFPVFSSHTVTKSGGSLLNFSRYKTKEQTETGYNYEGLPGDNNDVQCPPPPRDIINYVVIAQMKVDGQGKKQ